MTAGPGSPPQGLISGDSVKSAVNADYPLSDVASIGEIYGSYAAAEAHAGMGTSSTAQVMTKGTVSLELTGTGEGVDLGFSFGKFTIAKGK